MIFGKTVDKYACSMKLHNGENSISVLDGRNSLKKDHQDEKNVTGECTEEERPHFG